MVMKCRVVVPANGIRSCGRKKCALIRKMSSATTLDSNADRRTDSGSPFKSIEEYSVLESLFFPAACTAENTLPFVRQIKRLRLLEERRRPLSERRSALTLQSKEARSLSRWGQDTSKFGPQALLEELSSEMAKKIKVLVGSRAVSNRDIDNWLKIHIGGVSNAKVGQRLLLLSLENMINVSTSRSLAAVMESISSLLESGFDSIRFTSSISRQLVVNIFDHALRICDPTEYVIDNQQLVARQGIENIDRFKRLYDRYLTAFEIQSSDREIDDLLFQLVSKCGSIEMADEMIVSQYLELSKLPSHDAIDVFIRALANHVNLQQQIFSGSDEEFKQKVKADLVAYQELLASDRVTPAVIEFLLVWVADLSELYSVLELASNSRYADNILSTCQVSIINSVVKCALVTAEKEQATIASPKALVNPRIFVPMHVRAMAHMFGVLSRFTKCSAGITPDALDQCLLLSSKHGNSAGMYKALAMRLDLEERSSGAKNIDPIILGQVFDSFPIASGAMSQEKRMSTSLWAVKDSIIADPARDQAILYHLRTMIDPVADQTMFQKYIASLGRCSRSDRLYWEWNQFLNNDLHDWSASPDLILEFISAYRAADSLDQGLMVVGSILDLAENSEKHYKPCVSILRQVFRYEILPVTETLAFVADWFIAHKSSTRWLSGDIEQVFNEIGGPHAVSSFSHQEALAASFIGKEVARTVIQVQRGLDVEQSLDSLKQLLPARRGS
jgi:hypothetical protein